MGELRKKFIHPRVPSSAPAAMEEVGYWNGSEWVPYHNVIRQQDAERWAFTLRALVEPRVCTVHWGHFVNGKPKYPRDHPAVALWNDKWYLCQSALDNWLDNADEDPSLEPDRLVFL